MREPAAFRAHRRAAPWLTRSAWPCHWIGGAAVPPCVEAYRLRFSSPGERLRLIVTADERYVLHLDGQRLRAGPEIGSRWRWQADAIEVELPPGEHQLLAVVWSVGERDGDFATDGIRHGFALGVDGAANDRLATGLAAWEWHALPGYTFAKSFLAHWTVPDLRREASAADWPAEAGGGDGWLPVRSFSPVHHVADVEAHPARLVEVGALPPPLHQRWNAFTVRHAETLAASADPARTPLGASDAALEAGFAGLLAGRALTIPAGALVRAVIDCGTYLTAWPEVAAGGAGGALRVEWMEALNRTPVTGPHTLDKGQRDAVAGRYVLGTGDAFALDAQVRDFRPLYWRAGRFVIVTVRTAAQPVVLRRLELFEDRYPLEQEAILTVAQPGLMRALPLCLRSLQANAHDCFSDTPYFERMQYIGDCRLDCLNTYILARDDRLPIKALRLIDAQRLPDGLTVSRAPTRNLQVIPPFSLWYVGMLHDRLQWRDDRALLRELMPGARGAIETFLRHRAADGTVGHLEGWDFWDWIPGYFQEGEPPGSPEGSALSSLLLLLALGWAEELEIALDEPELAARWRRLRLALAGAVERVFWDAGRRLWADDRAHRAFSQHAQALAMLCPDLAAPRRRQALAGIGGADLAQASIYFRHYLIEAWAAAGDERSIADALAFWAALPEQGFCATPEAPEPSRSDCHAWGAHPLYHVAATLAGIRPAAPGLARVRIAPCLGAIPAVTVRLPHPGGGWIAAELAVAGGTLSGCIDLPDGVAGELLWAGRSRSLRTGRNAIGE